MSAAILIAVISAAATVLVAIMSMLSGRRTARELELLKSDLGARAAERELRASDTRDALEVLAELISAIQNLKEQVTLLRHANDRSLQGKTIRKLVADSHLAIRKAYGEGLSHLTDEEAKAGHDAKRIAFDIETLIHNSIGAAGLVELPGDLPPLLDSHHAQLTALQVTLREARMQRMHDSLSGRPDSAHTGS